MLWLEHVHDRFGATHGNVFTLSPTRTPIPPPKFTFFTQSCQWLNSSHRHNYFSFPQILSVTQWKTIDQKLYVIYTWWPDVLKLKNSWKCCLSFILQTQKSLLNLHYKFNFFSLKHTLTNLLLSVFYSHYTLLRISFVILANDKRQNLCLL